MKNHSSTAKIVTQTLLVATLISFSAVSVFAKPPGNPHDNQPTATSTPTSTPTPRPIPPAAVFSTAKLTSGLLQACLAHEQVIKTRTDNLVRMATNMLEVFDRISTRVQKFYKDHVLANGKSVTNYDLLVSDIQTKQAQ